MLSLLIAFMMLSQPPQEPAAAEEMLRAVQQSHIEANVPSTANFQGLLERDLGKHFSKSLGRDVQATFQLFRDGPTQSGLAYPKYYAWITITENGRRVEEGAVRVAAIGRQQFEVTDYLPASQIVADRGKLESVFPAALCESIMRRAAAKQ